MDTANSAFKSTNNSRKALFRFSTFVLLTLVLLSSCQSTLLSGQSTPTAKIASLTPAAFTSMTLSAVPLPTESPTVIETRAFTVNSVCPALSQTLPIDTYSGAISYFGRMRDFHVLLNLENSVTSFLPNESQAHAITSLDRNKIAYRFIDPNTGMMSLRVQVLDTHQALQFPWLGDDQDLSSWVDKDRLLFTTYSKNPPYSHLVFNPFTNESLVLPANYPDISTKDVNWNRAGATIYDQTLDYVIYAAWNESTREHKYVLWNISSEAKLAELHGNSYGGFTTDYRGYIPLDGVTYNPPAWSPDDTRVALIIEL